MDNKKRLIIIDSNSVIHRAFHALPPLTTKKGELVNAVYGFLLVFLKVIQEFRPDYIAACFDFPAATFRHKKFKEYKAKRPPAPQELYQQIPRVKEVLRAFGIPIFEKEGFEADDIIGTIARLVPKKQIIPEIETIILSGDRDILALVDTHTKVFILRKGVKDTVLYDENSVKAKYQGIKPEQLVDFKALTGDPSDNIPGVKGIGDKTAIELLKQFGTVDNLFKELKEKSERTKELKIKLKEKLLQSEEQVSLSQFLVKIEKHTPLEFNLKECIFGKYSKEEVIKVLKNMEFYSFVARIAEVKDPSIRKNLSFW